MTLTDRSWSKPIAYHYLPGFGKPSSNRMTKNINLQKGHFETIPAPTSGLPIIAYCSNPSDGSSSSLRVMKYCFGHSRLEHKYLERGVEINEDISTFFKDDLGSYNGYGEWSEQ